jgi:Cytochrome P450
MVYVTHHLSDPGTLALFLVFLACILLSPFIIRRNIKDKDGHSIPPGPLLRYAFLRRYPERALRAWAKAYGPLFSVWMGNQLFVVISDARIAKDLLVSNGAIFSSRKQYFIKDQTILNGRAITSTPYNDKWWVVENLFTARQDDVHPAGGSIAGSVCSYSLRKPLRGIPPSSIMKPIYWSDRSTTNLRWVPYPLTRHTMPVVIP